MKPEHPEALQKTAGIIAEYNPFHQGHAYQIARIRQISGVRYVIAVMSGDFVQRGAPALLDKYARTRMALLGGADLVVELPCAAATGSAALFAGEAVRILDRLGVVDELWFGSEAGDSPLFSALSELLVLEPAAYRLPLRRFLKEGASYPLARQKALEEALYPEAAPEKRKELCHFLETPNNILGLEYCLALKKQKSSIRPRTLKRLGGGYHDASLLPGFSSASALRRAIFSSGAEHLENQFPPEVYSCLLKLLETEGIVGEEDFSLLLKCLLLRTGFDELARYFPPDLARRILDRRNSFLSFSQFADLLKTKDRTRSGIQRGLMRLLLGIPSAFETGVFSRSLPCRTLTDSGQVRVLGFRRGSAGLLTRIKQAGGLVPAARPAVLPEEAYSADLAASNFYEAVRSHKTDQNFRDERTRQPVIL